MTAEPTATQATLHDILTILKYLGGGRDTEFAAQATRLPLALVNRIAGEHGYPDRERLKWAVRLQQKAIDADNLPKPTPRPEGLRVAPPNPTRPAAPPIKAVAKIAAPIVSAAAAAKPAADTPAASSTDSDPVMALVSDLVQQGLKSDKARVRAAAQKVIDCAVDLQTRLAAEQHTRSQAAREAKKRQGVLDEISALEVQLTALRSKLAKPKTARKATSRP